MSDEQRCGNCRYVTEEKCGGTACRHICHRWTAIGVGVSAYMNWCGEWQPIPAKESNPQPPHEEDTVEGRARDMWCSQKALTTDKIGYISAHVHRERARVLREASGRDLLAPAGRGAQDYHFKAVTQSLLAMADGEDYLAVGKG